MSTTSAAIRGHDDFDAIRRHLLANSKVFVERARQARGTIAQRAGNLIHDGVTIITFGNSRVVRAILDRAGQDGKRLRVIYVCGSFQSTSDSSRKDDWKYSLESQGIPTAAVAFHQITSVILQCSFALVGAESIVENGGVVSEMGTHQLAQLAKMSGKPFYVAAESYKFVRTFPLNENDINPEQTELEFSTLANPAQKRESSEEPYNAVDLTPPELITALITETTVQKASAVSEELIQMWDA